MWFLGQMSGLAQIYIILPLAFQTEWVLSLLAPVRQSVHPSVRPSVCP